MAVFYVIQVWAYHGVGTQGWRTVDRKVGSPYRFHTREAALAAMRQHFSNLREGISVRVHEKVEETDEQTQETVPPDSSAKSAP